MSIKSATSKESLDVALCFFGCFSQMIIVTGLSMVDSSYVIHDRRNDLIERFSQFCLNVALIVNVKSLKDGLVKQTLGRIIGLSVSLATIFNEVESER